MYERFNPEMFKTGVPSRESGASLPAILVLVGILGIIATAMSQVQTSQFKAQKDLDMKIAGMAVARSLNFLLPDYCPPVPEVLPWAAACATATTPIYLEIPAVSGPPIIKRFDPARPLNAQVMGDLLVRAKCIVTPELELKVEIVDAKKLRAKSSEPWTDISTDNRLCELDGR